VNWWDLDSLGQLWFAAENKIGGKYDDWECTKDILVISPKRITYGGNNLSLNRKFN
jgi:hypothetical protein